MMLWANNRIRFVLTAECNINCFYCHNEGQPKTQKYFSESLFNHVREIIREECEGINSVTFTGGEPLLHPQLEKFIAQVSPFTKSRTLVTNGLLLTQEKLLKLQSAGLTKIRLGVDSITKEKSRPTTGDKPNNPIQEIIGLLQKNNFDFEINTVITKFNRKEIPTLIQFCQDNSISGKFFEMVEVESYGDEFTNANMNSFGQIPFSEFQTAAVSIIKNCNHYSDEKMNGANYIFEGDKFEIRYCKYLCDFQLCFKTGTRIDPDGAVYVCMSQRGKFKIQSDDHIEISKIKIADAVKAGCTTKKSFHVK
jgi:GTP 3',8-cyclase